jgi:DNA-binding Xre family transcriptional regulator
MKQFAIRDRRLRLLIRQDDLALRLHDARAVSALSYIEQGHVMPTRTDMAALCETLGCTPTDLYDPEELDLSLVDAAKEDKPSPGQPHKRDRGAALRVWLRPEEKRTLEEAVKGLGYRSVSEWVREMRRNTLARYVKHQAAQKGAGRATAVGRDFPAPGGGSA